MIRFERGVFYPFAELEEQLKPYMSLKTFLDNLNLECTGRNRIFQNGLFGDEILQAIEDTAGRDKTTHTASTAQIEPVSTVNRTGKRGRPRKYPLKPVNSR
jgi:hypothetical protein